MSKYDEQPWLASYPLGLPHVMEQKHESMVSAWDATVKRIGQRSFLYYLERSITFAEADRQSNALATALIDGGLSPSDRVGIYLQNDPEWPITQLAAWKAGAIVVPLNPMLKARELSYHLKDAGVSVLVYLGELEPTVRDALPGSPVRRLISTAPGDLLIDRAHARRAVASASAVETLKDLVEKNYGEQPPRAPLDSNDVAMLTYTSGTTGPPKGAMNTHSNIVFNCQVCSTWLDLDESDVILGAAPLFHITGSIAHLGISQLSGAPVILFHRFEPKRALKMIERWQATVSIASITAYISMLNDPEVNHRNLSSLSKVLSGGAPVSPSVVSHFESVTGAYIHNVYGLTETTSPSHLTPLGKRAPVDLDSGALSVGLPVTGAMVRVVDPETRDELPVGAVGELTIEGPMVVPGYWDKPEETAHAIPEGRLHTGDVGFMNEEGWFFIVDRAKDQINAAGYKVWPREVEDVLYQHPAVREAAVVGVPDQYRGETVKAFVSLATGVDATSDELIAFCKAQMADYKYPRQIELLAELPKTTSGKILRRELRGQKTTAADKGD